MGPIFQEDITVLIVYVPNNRNSKYIKGKSMDLQREIDESTAIVREMSIPLYQKWTNTTNRKSVRIQLNSNSAEHLHTTSFKSKIHSLLGLIWNIHQNMPHSWLLNTL